MRSDINGQLAAIVSNNSGATEPATMYAYQWWADTSTGLLKLRNAANNAWITLRELDGTLTIEAGTVSAPGLAFASDLNTGIYSPGADQVAITTNGVERVEWGTSEVVFNDGGTNYDFRIEGDTVDSLFFVDASTDRVGLGTSSPSGNLDVRGVSGTTIIRAAGADTNGNADVEIFSTGTAGNSRLYFSDTAAQSGSIIYTHNTNSLSFTTNATTAVTIDSSQRVGIGVTGPGTELHISRATAGRVITRLADPDGRTTELRSPDNAGNTAGVGTTTNHPFVFFQGNTEAVRVDESKRLLVGTSTTDTSYYDASTFTPHIQLKGANANTAGMSLTRTDGSGPIVWIQAGSSGNNVTVNNIIGGFAFSGYDGANYRNAARIEAFVDGTPGSGDMPGRLVFSTTADGASSPTERMRISRDGELLPGTDNLYIVGNGSKRWAAIYAANGTIQTSDQRAKTAVNNASLGAAFISSLRPVSYKWVEGGKRDTGKRDADGNPIYESLPGERTHWGFIAQEVKQAVDAAGVDFGGWVLTDKDDPDSQQALRYDQFIAPLTKALQEALQKIEDLEQRLTDAGIA